MNRRSFLKRAGTLVGLSYVSPFSLLETIPIVPKIPSSNAWVHPNEIAKEALEHLEFSLQFIQPAMEKLCDNIDEDIWRTIKNESI